MLAIVLLVLAGAAQPTTLPVTRPAIEVVRAWGVARPRAGLPPAQARLIAERGAQIVATRNLLVNMGCADSASAWGTLRGHIRNVRYTKAYFRQDGSAVVTAELRLPADLIPCRAGARVRRPSSASRPAASFPAPTP